MPDYYLIPFCVPWCVYPIITVLLIYIETCAKYGVYVAIVLFVPCFVGVMIYKWYSYFVEIDDNLFHNIKGVKPETSLRIAIWIQRRKYYFDFLSSLSKAFVISFIICRLLKVFVI